MVWSQDYRVNGTDVVKHTFDWVSNVSGAATLPSTLAVSGQIQRVVIVPSATDEDGLDVLAGQGANLSATVASSVCPGVPLKDGTTVGVVPVVVDSVLTLNITNAGDTKAGKVVVYVR